MLRTFAALSCALAGGCLLTTSLSGLEGPPVASADDGGPDAPSSSSDASNDALQPSDAMAAPDTNTKKPCAVLFCDDFDDVAAVTDGWGTEISAKGSVALETSTVVSAPHAFAATVATNSDFQAALLSKTFVAAASPVMHLDMQVYIDQIEYSMGGTSFGIFGLWNGASSYSQARIQVGDGILRLTEEYTTGDAGLDHHSDATYRWPQQRWVHVRVDVTPTALSVTLDGQVYATLAKIGAWAQDKTQTQTRLKVGLYYVAGQQQRVLFDDIVFDNK